MLGQGGIQNRAEISLNNGRANTKQNESWGLAQRGQEAISYPESANPSVLPTSSSILTSALLDLPWLLSSNDLSTGIGIRANR